MIRSQSSYNDIFASGLLPYDEALARVLSGLPCVDGCERLPIEKARGRALHKSVISTLNVPSYTNSGVDGYALHSRDVPEQGFKKLIVKNAAFAGQPFCGVIESGECLRIMTGAPIPGHLDTVIMQEHVEPENGYITIDNRCRAGKNVRKAGEDIRIGDIVLAAGRLLMPPDIGLLAALGIAEIEVNRKLTIAVASTGNEVYAPGQTPGPGGLYDSNRYSLMAALARPDVEIVDLGILPDDVDALLKSFNDAGRHADVIISSGGVSVGEADYTKMALQDSGKVDFWRVAIKPGRPFAFGRIGNAAFFGLPGNPVAVMVTFYFFVLPALEKMLQVTDKPIVPTFKARVTEDLRKLPGRTEVQRAIISRDEHGEWQVKTTGKQGSGILSSMSRANAFIVLDHEGGSISAGEL
ncbi:MAG: molybdopterin molybdenumtransferase MoeA, partial [Candidatus Riflebacteria bacterium GWC2_50_8]